MEKAVNLRFLLRIKFDKVDLATHIIKCLLLNVPADLITPY